MKNVEDEKILTSFVLSFWFCHVMSCHVSHGHSFIFNVECVMSAGYVKSLDNHQFIITVDIMIVDKCEWLIGLDVRRPSVRRLETLRCPELGL